LSNRDPNRDDESGVSAAGDDALVRLGAASRAPHAGADEHFALGLALARAGRTEEAIVACRRALRHAPGRIDAVLLHADLLGLAGRDDLALAALARACAATPASPRVSLRHARLLWRAGRRGEACAAALAWIPGALRRPVPAHAGAQVREAHRAYAAGDRSRALAIAREVLTAQPGDPDALNVAATVLCEQGELDEALRCAQQAVSREPYVPQFQITLANCERMCDYAPVAIERLRRVAAIDPGLAAGHASLAGVLLEQEQFAEAELAARRAIELEPAIPAHRAKLSRALVAQGRHEDAIAAVQAGIAAIAEDATLCLALAQGLRALGRFDEAIAALERAVAFEPGRADAHLTLGVFLLNLRHDLAGAQQCYDAAQRADPDEPGAPLNMALLRMSQNDYSRASWDLYESRKRLLKRKSYFWRLPLPAWEGESLEGRGLLVYGEQGIGDEIMFASVVPDAAARAARCTLACDPRLVSLFARSFPGIACVPWDRSPVEPGHPMLEGHDAAVAAGSLGRYLRSAPDAFAATAPFLRADPARVQAWRRRLAALGPGPHVGLAWRGGVYGTGRTRRSLDLGTLREALSPLQANWISLQRDATDAELEGAREPGRVRLAHLPEAIADIDEAAALVEALDAVVTVCSWLVHLAGGLGKPVCVLAPYVPDFRYGLEGRAMRWYGSARIFRQDRYGDWRVPLQEVGEELGPRLAAARSV